MPTCVRCYETQNDECFFRKGKQFKTCNCCSLELQQKYQEGKIKVKEGEELLVYNQLYYIKNREKLLLQSNEYRKKLASQYIKCECGKHVTLANKKQHEQSQKHLLIIESRKHLNRYIDE